MKKIVAILMSVMAIAIACTEKVDPVVPEPDPEPEVQPQPEPEPEPTPEPEPEPEPWNQDNCIAYIDAKGELERRVELVSAASFVTSAGYYTFYMADVPGLSKNAISSDEFEWPDDCTMAAVGVLSPLVGKKVDISSEKLLWMITSWMPDGPEFAISTTTPDYVVSGGYFILNIDKEERKSDVEIKVEFIDGSYLWCKCECEYTPGGENETLFTWGDFVRPVRAAFYEDGQAYGTDIVMYLTNGEIDYGEDIDRTTYVRIAPDKSICDGQGHDIAECISEGLLDMFLRDFDSEWDIVSGTIYIKELGQNEYEVIISNAIARDRHDNFDDTELSIVFRGTLKDKSITRPIDNVIDYHGEKLQIKSCVVDLSGEVASIYMLQQEGITTVAEAEAADPLVINISTSKFGTSVGLSTDKAVFAVTFDGTRWDKESLDTGSFICHQYDEQTGLLHCQLANLWPLKGSKVVLKMEYKGTPVYIK